MYICLHGGMGIRLIFIRQNFDFWEQFWHKKTFDVVKIDVVKNLQFCQKSFVFCSKFDGFSWHISQNRLKVNQVSIHIYVCSKSFRDYRKRLQTAQTELDTCNSELEMTPFFIGGTKLLYIIWPPKYIFQTKNIISFKSVVI